LPESAKIKAESIRLEHGCRQEADLQIVDLNQGQHIILIDVKSPSGEVRQLSFTRDQLQATLAPLFFGIPFGGGAAAMVLDAAIKEELRDLQRPSTLGWLGKLSARVREMTRSGSISIEDQGRLASLLDGMREELHGRVTSKLGGKLERLVADGKVSDPRLKDAIRRFVEHYPELR
jgi:hypothetical protein